MHSSVLSILLLSILSAPLLHAQVAFRPDQQFTNDLQNARARLRSQQPALATNEVERLANIEARSNRLAQIIPELLFQPSPDFTNAAALLEEFPGNINDLTRYGYPLLFRVVDEDKMDLFRFLLAQKADPDQRDPNGEVLLVRAIERGRLEMAHQLLEAGASILQTNRNGICAGAAFFNRWHPSQTETNNLVPLMLARGLDPFMAVRAESTESILERCLSQEWGYRSLRNSGYTLYGDLLLTNRPSPSRRTPNGDTALHIAAYYQRTNAFEHLLKCGFGVDLTNKGGLTCLQSLVGAGQNAILSGSVPPSTNSITMADWLLARDATLDVFSAAGLGRTNELARLLVAQPELANARDAFGRTPLHYAVINANSYGGGPLTSVWPGGFGGPMPASRRTGWTTVGKLVVPDAIALLLATGTDVNAATIGSQPPQRQGSVVPAGTTPLHLAAVRGHAPLMFQLLSAKADIKAADTAGNTALHHACLTWASNAVDLLIRAHAPLNTTNHSGQTPLRLAVEHGMFTSVALLLDAGADRTNGLNGDTLLHIAATRGDLNTFKLLLDRKFALDAPDAVGRTPLHRAVLSKQRNMYLFLADEGARLNAMDHLGNNLLHLECAQTDDQVYHMADESGLRAWQRKQLAKPGVIGKTLSLLARAKVINPPAPLAWTNTSITAWLIDEGVKVNATNKAGWTPLHALCDRRWHYGWSSNGQISNRITALLDAGARIDVRDTNGLMPIHLAASNGFAEAVTLLIDRGGPKVLQITDAQGRPLLHFALLNVRDDVRTVTNLLAKGANPNASDRDGNAPLHVVVRPNANHAHRYRELTQILLAKGADPNRTDRLGRTPLNLATDFSTPNEAWYRHEVIVMLLTNRANPNIPDKEGNTPMHRLFQAYATNYQLTSMRAPIEWFFKSGVDLAVTNRSGQTPLHIIARPSQPYAHTLCFLRNHVSVSNAAFAIRDAQGNTPLHIWACTLPNCSLCADQFGRILAVGDNYNLTNAAGQKPLDAFLDNSANRQWLGRILPTGVATPERLATIDNRGEPLLYRILSRADLRYSDSQQFLRQAFTNVALIHLTNATGDTPLHVVIRQEQVFLVNALIATGADRMRPNARGETPLMLAAIHFPNGPASVSAPGTTMPFFSSLRSRDPKQANLWLDADPRLASITNRNGETPLMIATGNQSPLVNRLLELGAPIDPVSAIRLGRMDEFNRLMARRSNEPPPDEWLFEAVRFGRYEALQTMFAANGDVKAVDADGHSLLFRAQQGQRDDIASALQQMHCPVTPFDAVANGKVQFLSDMLNGNEALVNQTNRNRTTLLYRAVTAERPDMVQWLLARGAAVNTTNAGAWMALHAAAGLNATNSAALLLEAGADIEAFGMQGMGSLHLAAAFGFTNMARLLLDHGAHVDAMSSKDDPYSGNAPLHWAAHLGQLDMFKLLLAHGANVNLLNGRKQTALQYADITAQGRRWGFHVPPGVPYRYNRTMAEAETRDPILREMEELVARIGAQSQTR
jgi:ankyrin repeat protein